ncbi:hypothetical protein [Nocardia aurantiaca]|uniref:Uncharacterized protein n=1 Tax=Nocardia aurantiaca TaxID=2675850 RepID=A0A6I3KVX5_9NOCA|nr:hypothetical protein [Nocardia aurantiaca]MTE14142.1 hypothetical protein [Nocardia aurantiaca]
MNAVPSDMPAALVNAFDIDSRKRDVRRLTAALAEAEAGMHAAASFRSAVLGPHVLTGAISVSEATGSLMMAGQPLETSGTRRGPVPELLALALETRTADERIDAPTTSVPQDLPETVSGLQHGDLVEARFEQTPYGQFSVAGFALWAPAGQAFVVGGGWFVTQRHRRIHADRLIALTIVSPAGRHEYRIPEPIHRWPEPE